MSNRGSKFGDFVTGILLGAAVGYVIALLNAPRPGDETRQMLTDRSRELRDKAMDTVQTTMDKTGKIVSENRDKLGSTVGSTMNRMQDRISDLKDRSGEVLTNVRSQVSGNLHQVADQVDPNQPDQPANTNTGTGMTGPEI